MINAEGTATCDGCGRTAPREQVVRGGIGREEGAHFGAGLHQSFDYCAGDVECFAKGAIKVAEMRLKLHAEDMAKKNAS